MSGDHHGPVAPTDTCGRCCWLFSFFLFSILVAKSLRDGHPERLIHGVDYAGRICGVDQGVEGKYLMYWCGWQGDPESDDFVQWTPNGKSFPPYINHKGKACVETCPTEEEPQMIPCMQHNQYHVSPDSGEQPDGATATVAERLEITQMVVEQQSYPTITQGGSCIPDQTTLASEVWSNTLATGRSASGFSASMNRCWYVIFVPVAAGVMLLQYIWLLMMRYYAGITIFLQMMFTCFLMFGIGVFFLIGFFFFLPDPSNGYQMVNPLYHIFPAPEAAFLSGTVGILSVLGTLVLLAIVRKEARHIDEVIGLVSSAMDCLWPRYIPMFCFLSCCGFTPLQRVGHGSGDLMWVSFWMSIQVTAVFIFFLNFYTYVESIGEIGESNIVVNGEVVKGGIYHKLVFWQWWTPGVFYKFFAIWSIEICVSIAQYMTAHCASKWYRLPVENMESEQGNGLFVDNAQQVKVRVAGIDGHFEDLRPGLVGKDKTGQHKVLQVYVGHRTPGKKEVMPQSAKTWWKYEHGTNAAASKHTGPPGHFCEASQYAYGTHFGSLCKGSAMIFLTRFPRLVQQHIVNLMVRESAARKDTFEKQNSEAMGSALASFQKRFSTTSDDGKSLFARCTDRCFKFLGLLTMCLDAMVGRFSKDAYIHMANHHEPYWMSAAEAEEKILEGGGVVAFMMGACTLFEFIWISQMTLLSYLVVLIVAACTPAFNTPSSFYYISDPGAFALLGGIMGGLITYMFVLPVSHTCDTLIYNFADCRGRKDAAGMMSPPFVDVVTKKEQGGAPSEELKAEGTRFGHFYNHGRHMFSHALFPGDHHH